MDEETGTAFEELGPTRSSLPTVQPSKRSVPSAVKRIILELGLKYRPTAADALEGHFAKLTGLMEDLIDIPPEALERACRRWAREQRFLPRACELAEMARAPVMSGEPGQPVDMAARRNAQLRAEGNFHLTWSYDESGQIRLESTK